jgi:hypothetical protein
VRAADVRPVLGSQAQHFYRCTRGSDDDAEPQCQCLSGPVLDGFVREQILAAVAPAALEASLAAVAEVERERSELSRQWRLRLERARYEAERAARQYQACEPENRLVGRELERRWEEALKLQRQVEDEYGRWQRSAPGRLSAEDERAIRSLAADLPAVWQAATTTPAETKRIARLVLEPISVTGDTGSERVDVERRWAGGLVPSHPRSRPVARDDLRSDHPRRVARLRALGAERLGSARRRSPSGSTPKGSGRRSGRTSSPRSSSGA